MCIRDSMEITDEIAEGLLRTVMKYAKILHHDPTNYEARAEIMWSGSLAHNGLTGCGNDGGDFASHMPVSYTHLFEEESEDGTDYNRVLQRDR